MQEAEAIASFAALAHPHRLRVFRLLVRQGPSGMAAGAIVAAIEMSPTAASFHLKELSRAGLIRATRHGRYIRYAVDVEGIRKLLAFLTEDCCEGRPELCGSAIANARECCPDKEKS